MKDHENTIKNLNCEITDNFTQKAFLYNALIHYIVFRHGGNEFVYSCSDKGSYVLSRFIDNKDKIILATQDYEKMERAIQNLWQ